ncbi:SDR family NAD(P)-dependent oxidoreductase [Kordia zhangzhouensis]|uniref:SDR family NAD(P)-dependent oxidoreductase n=1 Tax=Kordia zhangzhouensis TaxID=1620405 RepID=UPI00062970C0|nr:SDR family oxidoreductase [Kordia zhangzhouensis]
MSKTALITGASSGIGKELARIHSEYGGNSILVARTESNLIELKNELEQKYNIEITIISKDLSRPESAKELYDEIKNKGTQIDYLLNNAGFGLRGKFHELPWERQIQMINLNMIAVTELMHLFLPEMVERNSGRILNTSSTASYMPGPLQAVYYATKSYVQFLSNAIAEELHDSNVTITNLMPGVTDTGFGKTAGMENSELFKNAVSPYKVAKEGYEAMLKGKLDVISGLTLSQKIMISFVPLTPKKILLKQIRKLQEN